MLYANSAQLTKTLLRLLQHKFGPAKAAALLVGRMDLLNMALRGKEFGEMINTYLEVFIERRELTFAFPQQLSYFL
jgi:hypothetical protein